jgi:hypothetical protein
MAASMKISQIVCSGTGVDRYQRRYRRTTATRIKSSQLSKEGVASLVNEDKRQYSQYRMGYLVDGVAEDQQGRRVLAALGASILSKERVVGGKKMKMEKTISTRINPSRLSKVGVGSLVRFSSRIRIYGWRSQKWDMEQKLKIKKISLAAATTINSFEKYRELVRLSPEKRI